MKSNIGKLKYVFLGIMLVMVAGFGIYDFGYRIPQQKCDARHGWWSNKYRICRLPTQSVDLPDVTPDALPPNAPPIKWHQGKTAATTMAGTTVTAASK